MNDWKIHGYNPCNRYNAEDEKKTQDAKELARSQLKRYLFYANRYMNHMQSLKFENKLYDMAKVKMEEFQQRSRMTWVEVQFLNKAVDVLTSCRQMLMFTYAFAFYLEKTNQVHIFEDNQNDLETATEKLSEYLERDLEDQEEDEIEGEQGKKKDVEVIRVEVQDKFRYCEMRREALIAHLKEGFKNGEWKVQDTMLK